MNRSFWFLPLLFTALLVPTAAWEASTSQNVTVTVTPGTQKLGLNPTGLTFPSQNTGTSSTALSITATNTGTAAFPLSSVAISGTNAGDFSQTNTCPTSLAVSATCQINAVFAPAATGTRTASVVVSATGGGTYTATLSGTGTASQTVGPGFYVATNGSDSNAGTLGAPFATIAQCQTAMQGSSTKTCYIRAGTYSYSTSFSSCYGNSFAAEMTSADNGETLSYYPPDGYGSAHITGGGTVDSGICLSGSGITVNGLDIGNFQRFAIASTNTNNTIENNTLHDTVDINSNGTLFLNGHIQGDVATHNYVYNSANNGIVAQPASSGDLNGVVISYNFVYNASSACTDCGAIYAQDTFYSTGTTTTITYNYCRDIATGTGGPNSKCIYLDDGASGFTVTNNIAEPGATGWACWQIHGGQNNTFTGNICDENSASVPGGIVFYQTGSGTTMAGNVSQHNIVLTATSGTGGGYNLSGSPTNLFAVSGNDHYGYGSATPSHSGSAAVGGTDSNPANVNPNFTCGWEYTLPGNSPVYSSPTSFPTQPTAWGTAGFWGPPGFVIPQVGTPPSPPHGC